MNKQAYWEGYIETCQAQGVDTHAFVKQAQDPLDFLGGTPRNIYDTGVGAIQGADRLGELLGSGVQNVASPLMGAGGAEDLRGSLAPFLENWQDPALRAWQEGGRAAGRLGQEMERIHGQGVWGRLRGGGGAPEPRPELETLPPEFFDLPAPQDLRAGQGF
jgi:hypothetical protein